MEFVGEGKKKATNSMHNSGNAIDIVINNVKTINFKFPKLYKHVGTRFGTSLNAEVFSRCGIMSQGAGSLQKKILQNSSIKLEKRLAILSAYIFTKGTFQCSTWSDLSPTAAKKFHGAIMSLYRRTIGMYHGNKKGIENINDEDILYQYNITNPGTMIRVARLSLWSRILCKAPKLVIDLCMDLASIKIGWPNAVQDDLMWLSGSAKYAMYAATTFKDWAAEIKGNRKGFIGNIKKFSKLRYANTLTPPPTDRMGEGCPALQNSHTPSSATKLIALSRLTRVRNLQFTCLKSIRLNLYGKTTSETMCIVPFASSTSTLGRGCLTMLGIVLRFVGTIWC